MRIYKKSGGLIQLVFDTQKELTMTMGRVQEYYESANKNLYRQVFSLETFISEFTDDMGRFDYYESWVGFNVPGEIMDDFIAKFDLTHREASLWNLLGRSFEDMDRYYVIATKINDADTMDHELVHAIYYLNPEYQTAANQLIRQLDPTVKHGMGKVLLDMGYAVSVLDDEVNAYLSTSESDYLKDRFGFDVAEETRAPFRQLAQEYLVRL